MNAFSAETALRTHHIDNHVLSKHYPVGTQDLRLLLEFGSPFRVAVFCSVAVLIMLHLFFKRLISSTPFIPPRDYRSYQVVNKKEFLYLYDEDELPSKAAIEQLGGARLVWAYITAATLTGAIGTTVLFIVSRNAEGKSILEDVIELSVWSLLLLLWAVRFSPTPYRPTLYYSVVFGSLVSTSLIVSRDVWPQLLFYPNKSQAADVRPGTVTLVKLGMLISLLMTFLLTPRVWYPVDPYDESASASPEQTASLASYVLSYSWIGSLVTKAAKKEIGPDDLPTIPDYDRGKLWAQKIMKDQKSSTLRTLLSLMRYDLFFMTFASFFIGASKFISPWAVKELLSHLENPSKSTVTPWLYVGFLFIGPLLSAWLFEFYVFTGTRLIVRVKAALTQSLMIKTLKVRFTSDVAESKGDKDKPKDKKKDSAQSQSRVGKINNLMSTDLEQLTDARDFFLLVGSAPIELTIAVIFLYSMLGWSALVGITLMLFSITVPTLTAKKMASIQTRTRQATDARIGMMNEVLNSVRIVKYFGLENAFIERIREKREAELRLSLISRCFSMLFYVITSFLPVINMLVTFGIYTNVMKQPLSASITFTSISLFRILQSQFSWIAFVVRQILYAGVSFKRIDTFLHEEEEIEASGTPGPEESHVLGYRNATLAWYGPESETDDGFRLLNLDITCVEGGLTVISGPVGSGKSSVLLGLLGEMRLLEGSIFLPRSEGIAYVSQTPWLQNATIKDNVLFGSEFNESRYLEVLEACALLADIDRFETGDQTEVGERGVTLSGGQKARLALARAVYSPTKIVLLDDVLSALDAGTIKHVFEKCIKGKILQGRTVVLVTHHVALVAPAADLMVLLDNGKIVSSGPPALLSELLHDPALENAIETTDEATDLGKNMGEESAMDVTQPALEQAEAANSKSSNKGKLILEEERAVGRVPKTMVWEYVMTFGGAPFFFLLISMSVILEFASIGNTLYVGFWSDAYRNPNVNVNGWLAGYAGLLLGTTLLTAVTYAAWYYAEWLAARKYHERLVKSVLYSPIRFFDTTPIGRIINRFSKDIKSIDDTLGPYLQYVFEQLLGIGLLMMVLAGLIPSFLVPTVFVCIAGVACGELYMRAQMGVKRIVSVRESPLISHFNDTISGVVTIRAFSCQDRFLQENLKRIDDYTLPQQTLYNLNRWIGVRINGLTSIVGVAAGAIALTATNLPPGLIGFSLTNALAFSTVVLYTIRYFNACEIELNSLERVNEYIRLKQEPAATAENQPPAYWPTDGDVEVKDLSVRYTDDGPDVLHKISFNIKPRERVGVVGRTGAGKSSLALSLLRFTSCANGSIKINGRDIEKVNLDTLRQRVTIIPQDPVLFSGTIRTNLDPFGNIDDSELQQALEGSGLTSAGCGGLDSGIGSEAASGTNTPASEDGGGAIPTSRNKITLDTVIQAGGENLSQGQRQLLAFARALVRRSKLVILDEATSSTDHKTDDRIQETLKTSFPDSSILCIAHRLRTVMNFDRILVLDNKGQGGEVVEYDTPSNLLKDEGGILYGLAKKSGEFDELMAIADGKPV